MRYGVPRGHTLDKYRKDTGGKMAQLTNTTVNGSLTVTGSGTIGVYPSNDFNIVNKKYVDERTVDYIIEEGSTSDGGSTVVTGTAYYRKWKNGAMEFWGNSRQADNVTVASSSWFSSYESPRIIVWDHYPTDFISPPFFHACLVSADTESVIGDYLIIYSTGAAASGSNMINLNHYIPRFKLLRGTTKLFGHPQFSFYAAGRWK